MPASYMKMSLMHVIATVPPLCIFILIFGISMADEYIIQEYFVIQPGYRVNVTGKLFYTLK